MFTKPPRSRATMAGVLAIAATLGASFTLPVNAQVAATNGLDALSIQHLRAQNLQRDTAPQLVNLVIEDVGGSFRIAAAGKLRMLSQRIASAACNYAAGVAPEETHEAFVKAKAEFRQILDALVKGDDSIGIIGPESQRRALEAVQRVEVLWAPYEAALDGIIAGTDIEANVAFVADNNQALLDEANILTSEVSAEYSNPAEMTQAGAMLVDISARQRMLTQKIAKEACGVALANPALGTTEKLAKTIGLYETSLNALLNGMPEAGINPAPTEELRQKLAAAAQEWAATKAVLTKLMETGTASQEEQEEIFSLMNTELAKMLDIAKLYAEHAKTKI